MNTALGGVDPAVCGASVPIEGKVWDRLWDERANVAIYLVKYAYS